MHLGGRSRPGALGRVAVCATVGLVGLNQTRGLPIIAAPPAVHLPPVLGVAAQAHERDLRPEAHLKFPLNGLGIILVRAPMQAAETAPLVLAARNSGSCGELLLSVIP